MGRRSQDNQIDWELIEREFRLGKFTLRQLAASHGVQPSAISRKAKREHWVQDKRDEVRAMSEAQLLISNSRKATKKATEPTSVDIEVAATVITNIVLAHRSDAKRARTQTMVLLSELETETKNNSLPLVTRTKALKALVESLAKVVAIEREAFGIDDSANDNVNADAFVKAMLNGRSLAALR